jgi:dolichol-phosphate mannosyltransferase
VNKGLVIIPTYNEKENIALMVEAVFELETAFDILVIDDGSPDGTGEIVKTLQQTWQNRLRLMERDGKQGLGTAYIAGFQFGLDEGYEYMFEMDCDFSHDPKDLEKLYKACDKDGFDLAIGSRYVGGLVNVVNWPIGRVMMSIFASLYVRFVTGIPVSDTTAGFKCYRRSVLDTIPFNKIKFVGYAFQIEMKFTAWKYGFKIKEIPIIFTDRSRGESKMTRGIFQEAVLGVIQMRVYSLFRKYLRHQPV